MKRHIFDLDNTLIYTDLLNNESYNYAMILLGLEPINDCLRITRDVAFRKYSDLSNKQKKEIIELKQNYFIYNLKKTLPNTTLLKILAAQNPELCVLWTSADEIRALEILKYYKIYNAFKEILFSNKIDVMVDIEKICEIMECGSECLIFYEDNKKNIQDLKKLGLNVISIGINEE